jgi:hypothetical protein
MPRPRVAAIVTEYRVPAHADVIVSKLLEGYSLYGEWTEPRIEVASLYLDQVPGNDIGREMAAKHHVPIFPTIGETIGVGEPGVNVDGVLLVGEHGHYPVNELGQVLYPRRRFFDAAIATMCGVGRTVPVFNDKHLSWSFPYAKHMYDTAKRLGIPFLAGSTLPIAWRIEPLVWPLETEVDEVLGIGYGPVEAYGYHALEMVQCMAERRRGGETGVSSVQCLEGDAAWDAAETFWSPDLFDAAAAAMGHDGPAWRSQRPEHAVAFLVTYRDGLRETVILLDGLIQQFSFAGRTNQGIDACEFRLQRGDPHGHFTFLVRQIESMIITGEAPYPVERTLLVTGILDALMQSRHDGHVVRETPELNMTYHAPESVPDTGIGAPPPEQVND